MAAVAFLGLGAMGSRMARRLVDAGHELTVWNRTPAKAQGLDARVADTPAAAAADAEVVVTMLADPAALHAVVAGREGVAAGIRPGGTLIEMSTVGPGAVRELSTLLPTGVGLLDAPVLGSISEAESGSLEIFVGGDEALVARWEPLLSELGRPLRAGPLGAGAAAKLVANAALLGTVSLLGETLALSDALGLDRDRAFEVLALTPLAAQSERRRPAIESGEYPPRFRLSLARKDADLIRDSAPARLELPEAVRRRFAEAEERGLGDADYSAVLRSILD